MFKHMSVGAALALLAGAAAAQAPANTDPIEGKASLGYISTSGNTDSSTLNAAFNLVWTREIWSHEFDLTAVKADNEGLTTAEAYTSGYVARRELGERSFLFGALNWEHDEFSTYDEQISETVGYGRRLIVSDRHELNGEIGAGARQAELRDGTEEDDAIVRGVLDYTWTISETASFTEKLSVESGSSNTRTESISELRANILGDIALVLSYRIRNNSDVLPGTAKTDRFTAISLEYAF